MKVLPRVWDQLFRIVTASIVDERPEGVASENAEVANSCRVLTLIGFKCVVFKDRHADSIVEGIDLSAVDDHFQEE